MGYVAGLGAVCDECAHKLHLGPCTGGYHRYTASASMLEFVPCKCSGEYALEVIEWTTAIMPRLRGAFWALAIIGAAFHMPGKSAQWWCERCSASIDPAVVLEAAGDLDGGFWACWNCGHEHEI